ncbi:olfactory receptor 14A16-like [Accipiter gentilis]|uniref:olfactory receptor 14A16-like n=1 Tax=Astur gentilis TaxID=8957 RepID=UPI00211072F9|nr:olfactory receptor 14A16-like [Accipiter gentilis]
MSNGSSITEFLLLAFSDTRELQLLHFWLLLGIYLVALLGNGLIITTVPCDHHLHTPMYFFLLNLSLLDLGAISTTVPKAMANSLRDTRAISYPGCAAQVFLLIFLISAELYLLTVMAYDCYAAICKPLHYGTLLGSRACVHMAAVAWGSGFLYAVPHTANTFLLSLCQGNAVDQFFCEIPEILKLACSDAYLREVGVLAVSAFFAFGCFVFIVLSYVQIFRVVLRIPSEQGRHKAFSMCLPHLVVVSLSISTAIFAYLKPPSISSTYLDLVLAVLYSVVPPALNPLIYSMRNQDLRDGIRKLITRVLFCTEKHPISPQMTARMEDLNLENIGGTMTPGYEGVTPDWQQRNPTLHHRHQNRLSGTLLASCYLLKLEWDLVGISTAVIDTGLGPHVQQHPAAGNGECAEDQSISVGQREG